MEPEHGKVIPESLRKELIEEIENDHHLFPKHLRQGALDYARRYLKDMENPTLPALWDYIVDRLRERNDWCYFLLGACPGNQPLGVRAGLAPA
jgi:hypothetical protein